LPGHLDLTPFPDATQDGNSILLQIEEEHGPRRFDAPMFYFLMAATAFGGTVRLNSREQGKPEGKGKFYPRLDVGGLNMSVNRIVANVLVGEVVKENAHDFRNHLPEGLRKEGVPRDFRPSKNNTTRADAVAAALRQHSKAGMAAKSIIDLKGYEALLWRLLSIADARWQERSVRDKVAVAPWEHPTLA
jgi:hypothetical protein